MIPFSLGLFDESDGYTETGEIMKKTICFLVCCLLFLIRVDAEYYIVLSDDERVIASENEHVQRSVASTSKIMTAILCLEYGDYTDQWIIGDEVTKVDEKSIHAIFVVWTDAGKRK